MSQRLAGRLELSVPDHGVGLKLQIGWRDGCWQVILPAWEDTESYWSPGQVTPFKYVPLVDYLRDLETEFKLTPKA